MRAFSAKAPGRRAVWPIGHVLIGNRNGLVAAAEATLATGTAEREAAACIEPALAQGATLGADKGYDAEAFVEGLKARGSSRISRSTGR